MRRRIDDSVRGVSGGVYVETVHRVSERGTDGSRRRPSGTSQEAETSMSHSYTQPVFITRRYSMQQPQRRSKLILGLMALGLLAGMALTAHPAQAVDAVGPYYALPSWDRKMGVVNRFVVLTNWNSEAVLDKETGLVWAGSPNLLGADWHSARFTCINMYFGNRMGWRLPSVVELSSLIDRSVSPGPTLPVGHPFVGVQWAGYWAATTKAASKTFARLVNVGNGLVGGADKADTFLYVWCVRGGMKAVQY